MTFNHVGIQWRRYDDDAPNSSIAGLVVAFIDVNGAPG
jgi:hypothetical protein